MLTEQEKFMKEAIRQAKKARALEEVPIGCVIVYEGKIIARGYNRRNIDKNTLAHAELSAIRKASKKTGDWRLEDCDLYVTLEPCQMCAGAIVQSRMRRVIIGSMNPKAGCAGSVLNLLQMQQFNHQVEIKKDVLKELPDKLIEEMEELGELDSEWKELLLDFEDDGAWIKIEKISAIVDKYAKAVHSLIEFEDLSFALSSLHKVLKDVQQTEFNRRIVVLFLDTIRQD